jgi:hypothetical protein
MTKFENTFKIYLNTLLNSSRNYCYRNSNKQNELTEEVGDMIEFANAKGFFMSYCMGVAETCKSVIFTKEKIEELKKLNNKKMHIEYDKIQKKLNSDSIKIIKDAVVGYKNDNEYFNAQLKRYNSTMKFFFYITSETKDFLVLSDKFKDMKINKISNFYLKHLNNFLSRCKEREKNKNPYDKFLLPHEQEYWTLYLSKELKEIYIDITPHTLQGYVHGSADTINLTDTINLPSKENKFYLLSLLQKKDISFKEKSIFSELIESKEELIKYKI